MHCFGIGRDGNRGPHQLIHEDDAATVDDANVDNIVDTETHAGRFGVQVEHVGAANKFPCPIECVTAALESSHHAPVAGLAARSTVM